MRKDVGGQVEGKNSNSIEQGIGEWVTKSGLALEMRTAQTLLSAGFSSVIQSDHYLDAESKTSRELDVVAYDSVSAHGRQFIVALVFECKQSADKPAVMLTQTRELPPSLHVSERAWTPGTHPLTTQLSLDPRIQSLSLFHVPERAGYRLAFAHEGANEDRAYGALMTLGSGCRGIVRHIGARGGRAITVLALPVLVISGRLFDVSLGSAADVVVDERSDCSLAWRHPLLGTHTFVRVVTEPGLSAAARQLRGDVSVLMDAVRQLL